MNSRALARTRPARGVCLALLCAGCGFFAKPPEITYFDLAAPALERRSAPLPLTLGIAEFDAVSLFDRRNFVYRPSPNRVAFDPRRQWSENPSRMFARVIRASLSEARVFRTVSGWDRAADLVLHGRVLRLEEIDGDGGMQAALEVELRIEDPRGRVLWRGVLAGERPVPERTLLSLVKTLDAILADALVGVLPEIITAVGEYAAGSGA